MTIELTVPAIEAMHERAGAKWSAYEGDVLSATVDEAQIVLVPDVMIGLVELCRVIAAPGESVAFATPAYPPFFSMLPEAGVKLVEIGLLPDGSMDLDGLDAAPGAGHARLNFATSPELLADAVARMARARPLRPGPANAPRPAAG